MTSVLHIALNPVTGPWSVIRELAKAQAASGLYAGVGIGVISFRDWLEAYEVELAESGLPAFRAFTPKIFGTASFLWQRLKPPPLAAWVSQFAAATEATTVVVHIHNAWLSGVFVPIGDIPGVEVHTVATFHGVNTRFVGQPIRHRLHRWMAQRLLRDRTQLTSVDNQNPQVAEDLFGIPRQQFKVIPNGVAATKARACPRLQGHPLFSVGYVGALIPLKGWEIATEAVIAAAKTGVPCRIIIAGRGPGEARARALAAMHPGIVDFRGFVGNPREYLMPKMDLLVFMSTFEGLPMSAVEALSVGLPVAGTNVGGMAEVVADGKTGFLVERAAPVLQRVITGLSGDRSRLSQLADASLAHFQQNFEISRIVQTYDRIYREGPTS